MKTLESDLLDLSGSLLGVFAALVQFVVEFLQFELSVVAVLVHALLFSLSITDFAIASLQHLLMLGKRLLGL